jgi:hypothetical protein
VRNQYDRVESERRTVEIVYRLTLSIVLIVVAGIAFLLLGRRFTALHNGALPQSFAGCVIIASMSWCLWSLFQFEKQLRAERRVSSNDAQVG